ncbi:hypothetical protein KQI18_07130 [Clostridioides mangenotii]|uniref:hypothetical protein n=1 Tax=Metaclostridioides mangenotii TaxID=1540 RepID=UPI001C0F77F8|nr:hypothetical protein [Clostridioides mangenotii]MBU5307557.1 hypothetical protein [Clostridioides mangenotii]
MWQDKEALTEIMLLIYKKHNVEIDLILMVLTRLQACQDSPYKCRENAMAITISLNTKEALSIE